MAIGFGLFKGDFAVHAVFSGYESQSIANLVIVSFLRLVRLLLSLMVLVQYLFVFISVGNILRQEDHVTGKQVADGPLTELFLQVWYLAFIFVIGLLLTAIEEPAGI